MQRMIFPRIYNDLGSKYVRDLEINEIFEIKSFSGSLHEKFNYTDIESYKPVFKKIDQNLALKSPFVKEGDIKDLWREKSRLDSMFDSGKERLYINMRDKVFPQDRKGSKKFSNRAGDKLFEINQIIKFFDNSKSFKFLDICGGPGAFSELVLSLNETITGYGITLDDSDSKWYNSLQNNNRYTIMWGSDNSGNIYNPSNLEYCKNKISESYTGDDNNWKFMTEILLNSNDSVLCSLEPSDHKSIIDVVVSDGGLRFSKNNIGEHIENFQESYNYRIILSEIVLALETLKIGGNFLCKIYDCFTETIVSTIYLLTQLFENVYITKPIHSRIVNSEKYIICKNLKNKSGKFCLIKKYLKMIHQSYYDKDGYSNNNECITNIIPSGVLLSDYTFTNSIREMNARLINKQTKALRIIFDKIDETLVLTTPKYNRIIKGDPGTSSYKIYLEKNYKYLSYWNDIPLINDNILHGNTIFNFVCEIPRNSNIKMEISLNEKYEPIMHDMKNGIPRIVSMPYICNYGAFPQTWENPNIIDNKTGYHGDGDPLDVCEISDKPIRVGDVVEINVLGALGMIDDGETDWKIIAINVNDKYYNLIRSLEDIEKYKPGYLKQLREWFRDYKIPEGKPPSEFLHNGNYLSKESALDIIRNTHNEWKKLNHKTNI